MSDYAAFPFSIDRRRGRSALADRDGHIRDLIQQVLFTAPGERVNRPAFGCALASMVFEPVDETVAAAIGVIVHGALDQWLGALIAVDAVEAEASDGALSVVVTYTVRRTGATVTDAFVRRA